jgi:hypothetical protein
MDATGLAFNHTLRGARRPLSISRLILGRLTQHGFTTFGFEGSEHKGLRPGNIHANAVAPGLIDTNGNLAPLEQVVILGERGIDD